MKIGNKEIPNMRLPALLGDLRTLYEKVGLSEVDPEVIAQFLGHKTGKSGAFLTKLAAMKDYGLLDGRGKLRVSPIGEKLAEPKTTEDAKNQAMVDAVTKIQLWKAIFEKYTKKGLSIPEADFWNDLREICELTIEEAKNSSPTILNAYKEDIKLLRTGSSLTPSMNPNLTNNLPPPPPVAEGMRTVAYGDWKVILPIEGMADAWETMKAMVNAIPDIKKSEDAKRVTKPSG